MTDPGFPVEPGDAIRYVTKAGWLAVGFFVRFNRNGRPVIRPAMAKGEKTVDKILPVNDNKMLSKRGRAILSGYNDTTTTKTKRGRRNG